tara:strand:+ start:14789 stop:16489 length:1701 start_codon:yes stop_codon:yes gene_type:complete
MITTDKLGIASFVQQCFLQGMKQVVCSPGSRNAPLIIAIDEHPEMKAIVIHDERSAAFFAMGMSQKLKEPVGVVCTSGSAMLNYYPAVAEAFYQCIPLVVISADRPKEWINHGDGQTIVQENVYDNHIRFQTTIRETIENEIERKEQNKVIRKAFQKGYGDWKGPIHFNVPISEPMYNTVSFESFDNEEIDEVQKVGFIFSNDEKEYISSAWNSSKKKLILCGQMEQNTLLLQQLNELSVDSSVAILVENTANLKSNKFVHCIDRTLAGISENEIAAFQPDILITIGGAVISKKIKNFLRDSDIKEHWRIGHEFPEMDTYKKLTRSFQCQSTEFFNEFFKLNYQKHLSSYGNYWKQKDILIKDKLGDLVMKLDYSDLQVVDTVLDYIPENAIIHMGNSSVVRYCQLFDPISSINYLSNRGTSGIDGSTSTAAGYALQSKKLNVLLTGDISFFYDSNALWNDNLTDNLRIILLNNSGGGIFRIIDGPSSTKQLAKFFEARHSYKAEKICEAFAIDYSSANSINELEEKISSFYAESVNERPKLLEIFTPTEINNEILKKYFNFIKQA